MYVQNMEVFSRPYGWCGKTLENVGTGRIVVATVGHFLVVGWFVGGGVCLLLDVYWILESWN